MSFYPDRNSSLKKAWTIDRVNQCTQLHHIEWTPGLSMSRYCFVAGFPFFPYHLRDEDLEYISFVSKCTATFCTLSLPYLDVFERTVSNYAVLRVSEWPRRGCAAVCCNKLLNLWQELPVKKEISFINVTFITTKRIVVLAPCAYHAGFNSGFSAQKQPILLISYGWCCQSGVKDHGKGSILPAVHCSSCVRANGEDLSGLWQSLRVNQRTQCWAHLLHSLRMSFITAFVSLRKKPSAKLLTLQITMLELSRFSSTLLLVIDLFVQFSSKNHSFCAGMHRMKIWFDPHWPWSLY